jgi:CxxC motif-containing protein (DUF1111 family)
MKRLDRISIGCALEAYIVGLGSRGIFDHRALIVSSREPLALATALTALALAAVGPGCASDGSPGEADGIFADLGEPLPSATPEQLATFERGRQVALRRFTPETGLGPELNLTFCGGCHEKPVFGGSASHYRDFLLVGDELSEGVVVPRGKNGVQRQFSLETERAASDPLTNLSATRNPIPFFGVGLLAEIPVAEIMRRADPDDADGDGISGRVNATGVEIGRFGRKAQTSRLELFVRGPIFNHMGITSNPLSAERRAALPIVRQEPLPAFQSSGDVGAVLAAQAVIPDEPTVDLDDVPDPELSESDLFDLLSFVMLLAAPAPDPPTPETERGRATFGEIGCDGCHLPSLEGPRGAIPAYTDLLLHDMGGGLADGFPMETATGREFRTQPLWGVAAVAPHLHDGRAATLDEAILWHGGEADGSRQRYEALPTTERDELLAFLESLGGKSQQTAGLLPPEAPIPDAGEYGAPLSDIGDDERAAFEAGRAAFDRDFAITEGVGPAFNGDACRSCHFDPVIGGAGPSGVDAMRQDVPTGEDTALLRHATSSIRPEPDAGVEHFERRQTPTTLGLGLLERIPREDIEAGADPDDDDEDGIAGRAHVLPDGRLGRFGWKANVPSVREFVRDAVSGELGMTVPDEPNFTFGKAADEDEIEDPEVESGTIDAIAAFITLLAPPPRTRVNEPLEDEGEAVFDEIGCVGCHRPAWELPDGSLARPYSDLLLHTIAGPGTPGITEGDAGPQEFRTPPLWGLGNSAPYLHDGRATTIEDAILSHAGEAAYARAAFEVLSERERGALLAFLQSL